MQFDTPLIRGTLVRRYKRFMADVLLENGDTVTAHCANSGSMRSVCDEGAPVWLTPAHNPKRKLPYTWEMTRIGAAMVGVNTQRPNTIVAEAIADGEIPALCGYGTLRREVKYADNSRIDILLQDDDRPDCYVEVKNVTMCRDMSSGQAEFPDAVTVRGNKHLQDLIRMTEAGHRAVMFYLLQRDDCQTVRIAEDLDPLYAESLSRAHAAGVEILCYGCALTDDAVTIDRQVDFIVPNTA